MRSMMPTRLEMKARVPLHLTTRCPICILQLMTRSGFPVEMLTHHSHSAKQSKDSDGREVCDARDAHARRHEGGGFFCTRTLSSKCRHEGGSDEQRRPRRTDEPRRERR
ncbi:hypothetical protein PI125_g23056 [Phytophthora idaei]|nr:hypothetical protein PI125_g23056 [Phytophthora idaei]